MIDAWPPAPHDPRERELAMLADGWEVRVFGGRKFQYFVGRGFLHVQLWHPEERISILTPSRLTCGFYEVFPVLDWKARAADHDRLAQIFSTLRTKARLPPRARLLTVERAFVDDIVRATDALAS